jgi:3-deoxy-D-manno-octulosonate 8-phosphate phosphatase (KDO 8-P phosphatase)
MNICFCIPARYESTRLQHKLLLKFNDVSCIQKTVSSVSQSKYFNNNIFVLTDDERILEELKGFNCTVLITSNNCINGSERISKHLHLIPDNYKYVVNVQADEPFISHENIDNCIEKHLENNNDDIFYTTLHEENNTDEYLKSTASIKLITDLNNNILYYSRNIIPWNKNNQLNKDYIYKTFTGIYVFNRNKIEVFHTLDNTELQLHEDCEQLKLLEYGYKIKSFPTKFYNEISLNTKEDYDYLLEKYCLQKKEEVKTKIKLVLFDLDGVFTDGKIYVSDNNQQIKCYNGKDTYGLSLLKNKNIKTGLITAHDTIIVDNMEHIVSRMDFISKGSYNKLDVFEKWKNELNLNYNEIAYIGDDLPDIDILNKVKVSACPNDAIQDVKNIVYYICKNNGGDGAVREFCNYIINNCL